MQNKACCKMKRNTVKEVLVIGTIIILTLTVTMSAASAVIFGVIFQRRDLGPYDLTMQYSKSDEMKYPREELIIQSHGSSLRGYLYTTENAQGVVIIAQGKSSCETSHLAEVFNFVDNGWKVVTFDCTGTGRSDGDNEIGITRAREDLISVVNHISTDSKLCDLPILLYGHSIGGYSVATLCSDSRISAIVSISGFNSPMELMLYYARERVGMLADIDYPFMKAYNFMLFGTDGELRADDCLENAACPVMVICGKNDKIVPYELSIHSACKYEHNENVQFELVSDEYKGTHSAIWLSRSSAKKYINESEYKKEKLKQYNENELPSDIKNTLIANVSDADDYLRELDTEFMYKISDFYKKAIQNAKR